MQVRKLTISIIIFLVLIVGVFGVTYFIQQAPLAENDEPVSQEIDTSDWKTYRNEEYGFEFKYPEEVLEKRFNIDESIKSYKEYSKLSIGLWPSGYQDYMMTFVVIDKGIMKDPDFLPPGLQYNYRDYEKEFNLFDKKVKGYESIIGSENYSGKSEFVSQFILVPSENYDYYINAGFFLSVKNCRDRISCYRITDDIISTFKIMVSVGDIY